MRKIKAGDYVEIFNINGNHYLKSTLHVESVDEICGEGVWVDPTFESYGQRHVFLFRFARRLSLKERAKYLSKEITQLVDLMEYF